MHLTRVISPKIKIAAPGDILLTPFANRSQFPFAFSVVPPAEIDLPVPFVNLSTFYRMRITTGTEPNIVLSILTNTSTFPAFEVDVAPSDEDLLITTFTNDSTFPTFEVDVAPADEFIRISTFTNSSSFGSLVVTIDDTFDDEYGPLGIGPIGQDPAF